MKYYCKHCGSVLERDSNKAWIKSFCFVVGKAVRITKVKEESDEPRSQS